MNAKGWALTAGIGAAAGAVAVLMMPRTNPTRRLAAKAANKMEDVAWKVSDTISSKNGPDGFLDKSREAKPPGRFVLTEYPEQPCLRMCGYEWKKWGFQSCR